MTITERIALMRAGAATYRAGLPSTECPYSLIGEPAEAARAAAWVRGYVLARRIAAGS